MENSSKNKQGQWDTFERGDPNAKRTSSKGQNKDPFDGVFNEVPTQPKQEDLEEMQRESQQADTGGVNMSFPGMPVKHVESINKTMGSDSRLMGQGGKQVRKRGLTRGGVKVVIGGQRSRRNQIESERRMKEMGERIERLEDELHRKMGVERELATVKGGLIKSLLLCQYMAYDTSDIFVIIFPDLVFDFIFLSY